MNVHVPAVGPTSVVATAPADVPWWRTEVREEEMAKVAASMRAERISGGAVTAELELAIARTLGVPYVVATT
jgi:dTDP-4-amino-4,6-dideoxygalactose transaminase